MVQMQAVTIITQAGWDGKNTHGGKSLQEEHGLFQSNCSWEDF
jgi:hypothetical protein